MVRGPAGRRRPHDFDPGKVHGAEARRMARIGWFVTGCRTLVTVVVIMFVMTTQARASQHVVRRAL